MIINKLLIWGGGKIKDATALPSDVRQGEIFYNNDGQQTGIYIPMFEGYSIFFPKIVNGEKINNGEHKVSVTKLTKSTNKVDPNWTSTRSFEYYAELQLDYDYLTAIRIDGVIFHANATKKELFERNGIRIFEFEKAGYMPDIFALTENYIYLMNDSYDFELYYGFWNIDGM